MDDLNLFSRDAVKKSFTYENLLGVVNKASSTKTKPEDPSDPSPVERVQDSDLTFGLEDDKHSDAGDMAGPAPRAVTPLEKEDAVAGPPDCE